jgi:hypothetical protein
MRKRHLTAWVVAVGRGAHPIFVENFSNPKRPLYRVGANKPLLHRSRARARSTLGLARVFGLIKGRSGRVLRLDLAAEIVDRKR